jgi:hypothetical protein
MTPHHRQPRLPAQKIKEHDRNGSDLHRWHGDGGLRSLPQLAVRVPVLFTHHVRNVDNDTDVVIRAIVDLQVEQVREFGSNDAAVGAQVLPGDGPFGGRAYPALFTPTERMVLDANLIPQDFTPPPHSGLL